MARSKSNPKKFSSQSRLGQQGINLIEEIVLAMKSRWAPGGPGEVGIDGFIELFDPSTGEAVGRTLAVQSKAVANFDGDTEDGFVYSCSPRDIEYWAQSNIPVVLVVSCPASKEAYWISIRHYFASSQKKGSTIHFSKRLHRFTTSAFDDLLKTTGAPGAIYLAPAQRSERLYSNLIELISVPGHIGVAPTPCRTLREVWNRLGRQDRPVGGDWIVRDKSLIGFEDFSQRAWRGACEAELAEQFDTTEWADSDDPERQRTFVQLLNRTLRRQVMPLVRYYPDEECYAFEAGSEDSSLRVKYRSAKRSSTVAAVKTFSRTSKAGVTFVTFRHMAFAGQFRRIDGKWYLEVTPTYRFTVDGSRLDRFHSERLAGIKRFEGNRAVLSAVLFWAHFLAAENELFGHRRPLVFGPPATFELPVGIVDANWSAKEPPKPASRGGAIDALLLPYLDTETFQ